MEKPKECPLQVCSCKEKCNYLEMITQIVADNLDETKQRLSNLKDADYFKAMGMLMKHVLPQQKQIEQVNDDMPTNFQIEIIDRIDQVRDDNTLDKVIDLMANE